MRRRRWPLALLAIGAAAAFVARSRRSDFVGAIRRGSMAARNAELARMG
ncbi:MAG: hypothetical protein RL391_1785, partial [Actinomycetota bacterium]